MKGEKSHSYEKYLRGDQDSEGVRERSLLDKGANTGER